MCADDDHIFLGCRAVDFNDLINFEGGLSAGRTSGIEVPTMEF